MEIKDLRPKMGNVDIIATVTYKDAPRTFDKFGKTGTVCDTQIKDASGEIKFTLWNEQVEQVGVGDKIHIKNGYADEFKGNLKLSTGKFGTIDIVKKGTGVVEEVPEHNDDEIGSMFGDD